jgi:hypothetical protein
MAGAMGTFQYTSDDTNVYIVRADASNAAAVAGVAGVGRPNLPHGYHERFYEVVDSTDVTGGRTPTGRRRKIAEFDPTTSRWIGGVNTVTLPDFSVTPSVAITWNISARIGERRLSR